MAHRKLVISLFLAVVASTSTARATAVFTLSSPSDLSALTVGKWSRLI